MLKAAKLGLTVAGLLVSVGVMPALAHHKPGHKVHHGKKMHHKVVHHKGMQHKMPNGKMMNGKMGGMKMDKKGKM